MRRRWHRKSDPDRQRRLLESRLLQATENGATSELKNLLEKGASAVCFGPGGTPLHYASRNGNLVATSLLLDHGAPCNIMGDSNYAPLHLASRQGFTSVVSMLLKNGAKVNIETKSEKRIALHMSSEMGHQPVIGILLDNQSKVDKQDIYGITALHQASGAGHVECVAQLLEAKADVDKCDNYGWTPLHLASQSGNHDVIKLLLDHHAFVDCQNKFGRTPLHWACTAGHVGSVELLLSRGAKVDMVDLNGKKPIQCTHVHSIVQILRMYERSRTPEGGNTSGRLSDSTIGDLIRLEPSLPYTVERRLSEVSEELTQIQRTGSVISAGERSRSDSTPLLELAYNPYFSEELHYDPAIEDTPFGQTCGEELKVANVRYKSLLRTVRALMLVMQGKTEALRTHVLMALDGTSSLSYVEVVKEIYTYLQSVDDSLSDFRQELHAETSEVTKCINSLLKSCMKIVDDKLTDQSQVEDMRRLHHVAAAISQHPGTWRLLHRQLVTSSNPQEERSFLDKIEELYECEADRAFDALYYWYLSRTSEEVAVPCALMDALYRCDLGNEQLINQVKSVLQRLDTKSLQECPSQPVFPRKKFFVRQDSQTNKSVSFSLPVDEAETGQEELVP